MSIEQLADDLYSTVDTNHCAVGRWYDPVTNCMCPIAQVATKKGLVTEELVRSTEGKPGEPRLAVESERTLIGAVARHYDVNREAISAFYDYFDSYGEDWDVDVALELSVVDLLEEAD